VQAISFDGVGTMRILKEEKRAHYFGLTLMGGYLYVTDWSKTYVL
jgi:hypothetical protein